MSRCVSSNQARAKARANAAGCSKKGREILEQSCLDGSNPL
jgi:hypothetical protein